MLKTKQPAGYKIWPYKMQHCFCCTHANWFRTNPDDEDSLEDMTVRCCYFPNEDKMVGIGANCSHFESTFATLKHISPDNVAF
jgi:hypothetical protein